jgi:hypothetical protein
MKPCLMSVTAVYVQSSDGDDLALDDQTLTLEMTHCGAGPYLVITTERWAMDRPKDLNRLVRQFAAQVEYLFDANQGV